jgi:hypothetical protein
MAKHRRATLVLFASAIGAGGLVSLVNIAGPYVAIAGTLAVLFVPLAIRIVRGPIDWFEPLIPVSAAFLILFVVRPVVDLTSGSFVVYGVDVSAGYTTALWATFVAALSFVSGHAIGPRRRFVARLPSAGRVPEGILLTVAWVATLLACVPLVAVASTSGLQALFYNRSQVANDAFFVPFLISFGQLAIPAFLLFWSIRADNLKLPARLASTLPAAVILINSIPGGNRRNLLPAIVAVAAFWYLRRQRRPSGQLVLLAVVVVFLGIVGPFRDARTGQDTFTSSASNGFTDPGGAVHDLLAAGDTEMIDTLALAVQQVGDQKRIEWQLGLSTLTETVLQPIPRQLWKTKPLPIRLKLIEYNWGLNGVGCLNICPTFSAIGTFYADYGYLTVGIFSFLLGMMFRLWWAYVAANERSELVVGAAASLIAPAFFMWWGSLSGLVVDIATYAGPFVACGVAASLTTRWDPAAEAHGLHPNHATRPSSGR